MAHSADGFPRHPESTLRLCSNMDFIVRKRPQEQCRENHISFRPTCFVSPPPESLVLPLRTCCISRHTASNYCSPFRFSSRTCQQQRIDSRSASHACLMLWCISRCPARANAILHRRGVWHDCLSNCDLQRPWILFGVRRPVTPGTNLSPHPLML